VHLRREIGLTNSGRGYTLTNAGGRHEGPPSVR
jgi:hypothetical protein